MASGEEALLTGKGERRGRCQPGKPARGAHPQLLLLLVLAIRQGLTSYDGSHGWLLSAVEQPLQDIRLHNAIAVTQQYSTSVRETVPKRVLSLYATCRRTAHSKSAWLPTSTDKAPGSSQSHSASF